MQTLSKKEIKQLCELLVMQSFDRGEVVIPKNELRDNTFFLKSGTVKVVDQNTGAIKYIVNKGNIFGEVGPYRDGNSSLESAVALEETILCYIDKEQMDKLTDAHPELKSKVLTVYAKRLKNLEKRLNDLVSKDSQTRIFELIENYVVEYGYDRRDGSYEAKNLLTHEDIAHLTNTSKQTVSNVLSSLRKTGEIDYDSRTISIKTDK